MMDFSGQPQGMLVDFVQTLVKKDENADCC